MDRPDGVLPASFVTVMNYYENSVTMNLLFLEADYGYFFFYANGDCIYDWIVDRRSYQFMIDWGEDGEGIRLAL